MDCYFAHLPPELLEITDIKEPAIRLIASRHCANIERSCSKKCKENPCCLGDEANCQHKCCNKAGGQNGSVS